MALLFRPRYYWQSVGAAQKGIGKVTKAQKVIGQTEERG
jgi:hypothetical protein